MIPRAYINAWRATAPWLDSGQVEQDLVISRALVELYNHPEIASGLAFRGGTALHKLYLHPAGRYSEDIDLVQITAGPIGQLVAKVRQVLDPWLGPPMTARAADRFSLNYRFASSFEPVVRARLKVEINTREHFSLYGLTERPFTVSSPWFTGSASITTYCLSELLGTKLRALFQRKKGRDLFDLWVGLRAPEVSVEEILASFAAYMALGGVSITRARLEGCGRLRISAGLAPAQVAPFATWPDACRLALACACAAKSSALTHGSSNFTGTALLAPRVRFVEGGDPLRRRTAGAHRPRHLASLP